MGLSPFIRALSPFKALGKSFLYLDFLTFPFDGATVVLFDFGSLIPVDKSIDNT